MNTPWTLEEQTVWPFDLSIKDCTGDYVFEVGRRAYSTAQHDLKDVYEAHGFTSHKDEAVKANAEQKAMLDGVVRAVNSHESLVAALEAMTVRYCTGINELDDEFKQACAALALAKGEA